MTDSAPPPYSEHRYSLIEGISWDWAKVDRYITAERVTPKVFFALQTTLALYARNYGKAKREHGAQQAFASYEHQLWWSRTCSTILCVFTESALPPLPPLPRVYSPFSRVIEVLRHASLESFGEYASYFWLNGEVTTEKEAFGIADTLLNELDILGTTVEREPEEI
jgi:hypothetical protein